MTSKKMSLYVSNETDLMHIFARIVVVPPHFFLHIGASLDLLCMIGN